MIRHWTGQLIRMVLILVSLGFLTTSCTSIFPPRKSVYIPPEFVRPLPTSEVPEKKTVDQDQSRSQATKKRTDATSVSASDEQEQRGPVIQPLPAFQEKDLPSSDSSASPPKLSSFTVPGTPTTPSPEEVPTESPVEAQLEPQQLASMHLVDQAKTSMARGNVDQAISALEQSIQVDVYNGDAFFNLAQAWRTKGDLDKALEFANKAEILYKDSPSKLKQVYRFEADIYMALQEYEKAELLRQKASGK